MGQDSQAVRKRRRLKRTSSLVSRALTQTRTAYLSAAATLLSVLAQSGGEVTVTRGTMEQVSQNLQSLSWKTIQGEKPNEFIVRMESAAEPHVTEPPDAPTPIAEPQEPVVVSLDADVPESLVPVEQP